MINRRRAISSLLGGFGLSMVIPQFLANATSRSGARPVDPARAALGPGSLTYPYELPDLPYDHEALAPNIDERTMQVHHGRHHQGYVNNLNNALEGHDRLQQHTLGELLADLENLPDDVRTAIRNNGGGHYNHALFWPLLTSEDTHPHGALEEALAQTFESLDAFKEAFNSTAGGVFGSGWGWLATDAEGNLELVQTANQDTPLELGLYPVIGVDVWEHAYYLEYENRRGDYLETFWNVLDWEQAEENYTRVLAG